jgi:hypothetical protein
VVDEFQDTDPAQFLLIDLLKRGERQPRLMVIGDPRQSIYRFRGADPDMMGPKGPFRHRFRGKIFPLARNYRCGSAILERARALRWSSPLPGSESELLCESGFTGFTEAWVLRDELAEARFLARRIATALLYGLNRIYRPEEIAILVRNNYQIDLLTEALRVLRIPFAIAGDIKFYRTEEVATVVSLLKAAFGMPEERDEHLRRAFAGTVFGFPGSWVQHKVSYPPELRQQLPSVPPIRLLFRVQRFFREPCADPGVEPVSECMRRHPPLSRSHDPGTEVHDQLNLPAAQDRDLGHEFRVRLRGAE